MSKKCLHCGGPVHPLERCPPARKPMEIEGRVFALTGPQMLELADLLEYVQDWADDAEQARARHWTDYLRREHIAHFGELQDPPYIMNRPPEPIE